MPNPSYTKRDDRYKWFIRDAVMNKLYARMDTLLKEDVKEIAVENCKLIGATHLSFAFNGEFYNADSTDGPHIRQKLHPSLIPRAERLDKEFGHALTTEKVKVRGYLASMLAYSPYPGDYLLLLPQAIHATVKQSITTGDWSPTLSSEKITSFMAKHGSNYELIRQRLALNLIL